MAPPRRSPFPWDVLIGGSGGLGVMLGRSKKGAPLIAVRPGTMDQVAPSSFEYGSQSPLAERIQVWDDLTLGYGMAIQEVFADRHSRYCINADNSIGGQWCKGPAITTLIPSGSLDATNGVLRVFEVAGVAFSLNGRYVHRRISDASWVLEKDFGLGKAATNVLVFATNAGAITWAYVGMGDGELMWRFDGTTWTQHATLKATHLAMVGRDIYRSTDTNLLAKCDSDADPWVAANWGAMASFRVGDKSSPITRLQVTALSQLVIFKTDGIYTLEDSGEDNQLYPFLHFAPTPDNGRYGGQFLNDLHTTYNGIHYRLAQSVTATVAGTLELQQIGPERAVDNNSPVRGHMTAFCGVGGLFALGALYDRETGLSYLLKFGSYLSPSIAGGKLAIAQRVDAWHGSISHAFTGQITELYLSGVGAIAGHTRTYIGFADGSVGWFGNPCVPNPAMCEDYDFASANGEIYLPWWHGLFRADYKSLRAVTIAGTTLDAANYAQFEYKLDPAAIGYTALGTNFISGPTSKVEFATTPSTRLADFRVLLVGERPLINGVALHHNVRPSLILAYEMDILAVAYQAKRDGSRTRSDPSLIRELIRTAASGPNTTNFVLPDESNQDLSVVDYAESMSWDARLESWQASLHIKAIQTRTNTIYGSVARLGAYRVGDLTPFSIAQLGFL